MFGSCALMQGYIYNFHHHSFLQLSVAPPVAVDVALPVSTLHQEPPFIVHLMGIRFIFVLPVIVKVAKWYI